MTQVRAIIDGVRDNGARYNKGDEFDMAEGMVNPHITAGQVERVADATPDKAGSTPADKNQNSTPKTK